MIVGYPSEKSHGTLAQELAHAMGRLHAPCGVAKAMDTKYPYADASIGTWGWDLETKELVDPNEVVDFMSYCSPVWVSDYTYAGLYNRMIEVQQTKRPDALKPMKSYHVSADGKLREGPMLKGGLRPSSSATESFVLENSAHQAVGKVQGTFHPLSGIGGGILVVPNEIPPATLSRARFARSAFRP